MRASCHPSFRWMEAGFNPGLKSGAACPHRCNAVLGRLCRSFRGTYACNDHKSCGVRPVCLAMRDSILGPISTPS
jgi:hypothetical protein